MKNVKTCNVLLGITQLRKERNVKNSVDSQIFRSNVNISSAINAPGV